MATATRTRSTGLLAKLVYDGGDEVFIPDEMGVPRGDQMQGTPAERLTELAGRVCYDSLGKGRPSFSTTAVQNSIEGSFRFEGYHDHINHVNHGSVQEHFNFTLEFATRDTHVLPSLINRPGLWFRSVDGVPRVTMNLRAAREWDSPRFGYPWSFISSAVNYAAHELAPHVVPLRESVQRMGVHVVEPATDEERWVSMYMVGSRGFSHEQVRHGDFTAISQRSTRYVDESESPWIEHPLLTKFFEHHSDQWKMLGSEIGQLIESAKCTYSATVQYLEEWLTINGVDKLTARKQARGAARGYLGNALQTEMIFSASVAQWRWMLNQRCSDFADAEIRLIYNQVLSELKRSRYADRFADLELRPAKDGIGMALA